ncbi:hypothetical protein FRC20_005002 [Serendipita sp. 405]|nr:hypothetical protein FRC15_001527 [Serendipita sp. 397]KAG8798958.1 hypothetical protein FRC16_006165 [Serendipita sp. 398]KAG8867752.1 hypothetical protein FRC20_005002 [Serendipita sp. 405]
MHPSSLFIILTLLGLTPAFAAPVPQPLALSDLLAKAKGDPTVLLHDMAPLAKQLTELITSMESGESPASTTTGAEPATTAPAPPAAAAAPPADAAAPAAAATPAAAPAPAPPADAAAASAAAPVPSAAAVAAPAPAPADPSATTGNTAVVAATPDPNAAATSAAPAAPATPDPAAAGTAPVVQRRDVPHAYNPGVDKLKPVDLRALRTLVNDMSVLNQAIEKIYLDAGKSIDAMPTADTPEGTGWGLLNGLTFGLARLVSLSKDN